MAEHTSFHHIPTSQRKLCLCLLLLVMTSLLSSGLPPAMAISIGREALTRSALAVDVLKGISSGWVTKLQRLQFGFFVLLSNIVGFPILRVSLAGDLERFCEYGFTVGGLFSLNGVFDCEDMSCNVAFYIRSQDNCIQVHPDRA